MQICKFDNNNIEWKKKMLLSEINLHLCSHKIMAWNRVNRKKNKS